jgi:hypothetical protein
MVERKGPHGVIEFRQHAVEDLRGIRAAKPLKARLLQVTDLQTYLAEIEAARGALRVGAWESDETHASASLKAAGRHGARKSGRSLLCGFRAPLRPVSSPLQ